MQNKRDSDVWKRFNRKYALIHSYAGRYAQTCRTDTHTNEFECMKSTLS